MPTRTDRLVDHLEAGLDSSEPRERRYHLRHALQYAKTLRTAEAVAAEAEGAPTDDG